MTRIHSSERSAKLSVTTRDNQYHTYADYLDWSRTSGDELIEGAAYVRQPSPTGSHQLIVGELYYQVRIAVRGTSWRVCVSPLDVRLPKSNEPDEDVDTVVFFVVFFFLVFFLVVLCGLLF